MSNPIDGRRDSRFQSSGPIKIEKPEQKNPIAAPGTPIEPALPNNQQAEINLVPNRLRDLSLGEVLTNLGPNEVASSEFNHGLITFDLTEQSWLAFCCPSPEAIEHGQPGQDKMGVISLDGVRLLVLQADGVGSSYDAANAAGYAVRETGQNGTTNLQQNLELMGEAFRNWGASVAKPRTDLPDLVINAMNETRVQQGTQTTFNQYLVNTETGIFRAHILGDGYYAIVRANGAVEKYPVGDHHNRLTSRKGIEGNSAEFGGQLSIGDTMFIYSDGMDGLVDQQLTEMKNHVASSNQQATKDYLEKLVQSLSRDDDRSLFAYRYKGTQTQG